VIAADSILERWQVTLGWDDMRVLLEIGRSGTLNGAARTLGLTQPTVSRRLNAIEHAIGTRLFERTPTGLVATNLCRSLMDSIAPMEQQAHNVQRALSAHEDGLSGELTVTSIDWVGDYLIAPLLARFSLRYPQVELRLINDVRNFNLAAQDADVSLAFHRLSQENLVQRRICTLPYCAYAKPECLAHVQGDALPLVMIERSDASLVLDDWRQAALPASRVVVRVNSMNSVLAAVLDGKVAGILPGVLADRFPQIQRVRVPVPDAPMELRIGYHRDMRHVARIRTLVDFFIAELPGKTAISTLNTTP